MDKSWIELERGDSRYIQGLIDFVEFAKQIGEKTHLCPCRKCLLVRGRIFTNEMVVHLINNGMMNSYTTWTSHGERSIEPSAYQLRQEWLKERYGETSSSATHQQANRTLEILHDQFPFRHIHEEDHMNMNAENGDSDSILAYDRYTNLVGEAQTPLYKGCDHTVLETILRAMQMKVESRLSDKGFDKMLHNTKKILPPDNNYPGSYKDVKKVLRNMGMGYETIHACEHGCVLSYKEFKDQLSCPVCGEARYTQFGSKSKVPKKTVKYFPLTPRLQRLYMSPHIASQMRWHANRNETDPEYIRHPADGESWQNFDKKFPEFASEIRNVRLGLATDGFNPFGASGLSHSTWPIVLIPYNLPPHICMKKEFNILSLLISGPKSPGKCLNVFMRPLIDELKVLWDEGCCTFDRHVGSPFIMKAAVMWTISDFPGLGMLGGLKTKGYKACPLCLDEID
ncbi:unnamed protein product [Rhodiola kirilowii]